MNNLTDEQLVDTFVLRLSLGPDAGAFLRSLPEDVRSKVIRSFDPRGTKDGNVFGRLQAFARSMLQGPEWSGHYGAVQAPVQEPVAMPEPAPALAPLAPVAYADPGMQPAQDFQEYAWSIGLDENGVRIASMMPQDVRDTVVAEFTPRGTKDGNVLGRLLGFARVVWAQRLGLDPASKQEAAGLLRGLSEEAQARVMAQFDVSGTKDGNILARLQRFATDVANRFGCCGGKGGGQPAMAYTPAPAPVYSPPAPAPVYVPQPVARDYAEHQPQAALSEFVNRMGLDAASASFLQSLPDDVRSVVVSSFNPAGTKDGYVWGRLFGFVRSVWAQRLGLDIGMVSFLKGLPEETQRVVMVKFDPSRTKDGNIAARLESFARSIANSPHQPRQPAFGQPVQQVAPPAQFGAAVVKADAVPNVHAALRDFAQRWGLNEQASAFLRAAPEAVSSVVVASFNANGTKDGNVWGRLFGFVRSVWSQKLGLDNAAFGYVRGLPEDVQMEIITRFAPGQVAAHELLPQLQAVAEEVRHAPQGIIVAPGAPEDPVSFAQRCGLDAEAIAFLLSLSEDVRTVVITDFDPAGTKDGNVFSRLQNFARAVENRRKRMLEAPQSGRNVRPRWGES
uniref:Uncharacterized protein n=1 Tax=Alexandrium monilatum TaxID=311494 RepID=A0A7S4R8T6_9DINO|mmetsp:Transcript_105760/g.315905  ORF Transcript_105760/g.315905 Transcript_105760/m.315905 type:complete len:619 (-) Transcript_105760:87-1943(-)